MKFSTRAERIEPFYVMEVAKAAQALAASTAGFGGRKHVISGQAIFGHQGTHLGDGVAQLALAGFLNLLFQLFALLQ